MHQKECTLITLDQSQALTLPQLHILLPQQEWTVSKFMISQGNVLILYLPLLEIQGSYYPVDLATTGVDRK